MLEILVIAVGLAMDAFAVSVASGAAYRQIEARHALRAAVFFGGFQAIMPLVGYMAGLGLKSYIQGLDHWLAFGILAGVGGKMAYESVQIERAERKQDISSILVVLVLAVATSMDALAVGISLPMISSRPVLEVAIVIGTVTFCLCLVGIHAGKRIGGWIEARMELIGGLILIGVGTRILIGHLCA